MLRLNISNLRRSNAISRSSPRLLSIACGTASWRSSSSTQSVSCTPGWPNPRILTHTQYRIVLPRPSRSHWDMPPPLPCWRATPPPPRMLHVVWSFRRQPYNMTHHPICVAVFTHTAHLTPPLPLPPPSLVAPEAPPRCAPSWPWPSPLWLRPGGSSEVVRREAERRATGSSAAMPSGAAHRSTAGVGLCGKQYVHKIS